MNGWTRQLTFAGAAAVLLPLAGCYVATGPGPRPVAVAPRPYVAPARAYVAPPPAPVAFDVYYDGFYGARPIYGGYWRGNSYYYRTRPGGRYVRDVGHHFRRDSYRGFNGMRYQR